MKIVLLTRDLDTGGVQRHAVDLARALGRRGHRVELAAFRPGGLLAEEARQDDTETWTLGKRRRWHLWGPLRRLALRLRRVAPDVVYGQQELPNVALALLAPLLSEIRILWEIGDSGVDYGDCSVVFRLLHRAQRLLSPVPARVVFNSHAGREHYLSRGFPADRSLVIPYGLDTERFRPDPEEGVALRRCWGVGSGDLLVGLVGRLHPKKGHDDSLRAAADVARRRERTRFVCVGRDYDDRRRPSLRALARELGIEDRVRFEPPREDVRAVYSALDLLVLASRYGEGSPNVVGEAMACEVPVVVTDVGDTARMVGDVGEVVAPGDPEALAGACRRVLGLEAEERASLGRRARERIRTRFGLERLAERTERLMAEVVHEGP